MAWQEREFGASVAGGPLEGEASVPNELVLKNGATHWHIVLPDRRISGKVVDKETMDPLPGAEITIERKSEDGGSGLSLVNPGPDGRFFLEGAEQGRYKVSAAMPGYLPLATELLVHDNREYLLDLEMVRGFAVDLEVRTADGEPIAEALVLEGLGDGVNPEHWYRTDASGRLALPGHEGETQTLYVLPSDGSFTVADVFFDTTGTPRPVTVPPAAGTITVRSTGDDGTPVPNVIPVFRWNGHLVPPPIPRFFLAANPLWTSTVTDAVGIALFQKMPAGSYEFFACRSEADIRALLEGHPRSAPVRMAFTGGAIEVALTVSP